MSSIAKLLGVSRSTLYTYLPELLPAQRGPAILNAPAPAAADAKLEQ